VLVSSLVVVFAVTEVLVLPFVSGALLAHEPLVAGAWMGLAVKTDGAAVAAGGIAESLILAKNAAEGVRYQPGWILGTATTIKVFIDIFIGVWAFVLGYYLDQSHQRHGGFEQGEGQGNLAALSEIHHRLRGDLHRRPLSCARHPGRGRQERPGRNRRGQHLPGHLLHPDLLLDRRAVGFQVAVAGGLRQARRGLRGQPVRLRGLGRAGDFVDLLPRRHSAAGGLTKCRRPTFTARSGNDAAAAATSGRIRKHSKEFTMSEFNQSDLREELRTTSVEPLLPIEKKLIGWSLAIGLLLLAVLAAANYLL
jgi:hypothetical protein